MQNDNKIDMFAATLLIINVPMWWFIYSDKQCFEICTRPMCQHHSTTVTSHERHGVSNHRQLVSLFNSLSMLTSNTTPKLRITCPLRGESTGDRWFLLTKAGNGKSGSIMISSWVLVSLTTAILQAIFPMAFFYSNLWDMVILGIFFSIQP